MIPAAKALLFDYGGTLDSDGIAWKERFSSLYQEAGIELPAEVFDRAFYDADDNLFKNHSLEGLNLEKTVHLQVQDVFDNFVKASALPAEVNVAETVTLITNRFVADSRAKIASLEPLLTRLRDHYSLGIVSNFYGNLEPLLRAEGVGGLFNVIADSEKVGATKPDKALFNYALNALEATPGQAWMVGDSVRRDMKGAENLGMPHVWIAGTRPPSPCCEQGQVARSVAELEALLLPAKASK